MKYLILGIFLIFSFNLLAVDFSITPKKREGEEKVFQIKFYGKREAKDGSTVEVVERTVEINLRDLDEQIRVLQEEIADLKAKLNKKQAIRQKLLELSEQQETK